jgi:hypothetical protein
MLDDRWTMKTGKGAVILSGAKNLLFLDCAMPEQMLLPQSGISMTNSGF